MERGAEQRATGATKLNEMSSRSHAVFIIIVEQSVLAARSDDGGVEAAAQQIAELRASMAHPGALLEAGGLFTCSSMGDGAAHGCSAEAVRFQPGIQLSWACRHRTVSCWRRPLRMVLAGAPQERQGTMCGGVCASASSTWWTWPARSVCTSPAPLVCCLRPLP